MTRARIASTLSLVLLGCASRPDPRVLCGIWAGEDLREQWWLDGEDLRGEGRTLDGGVETVREQLALRRTRGGHVYVATPAGASATEFAPIDPDEARFGPSPGVAAPAPIQLSWANYAHDFPQEIHYLIDGDRLTAIVSGPQQEHGWRLHRAAACSDKSP